VPSGHWKRVDRQQGHRLKREEGGGEDRQPLHPFKLTTGPSERKVGKTRQRAPPVPSASLASRGECEVRLLGHQVGEMMVVRGQGGMFKVRFAECATQGVATTCHFGTARSGVIVALLSIGTFVGASFSAPYVEYSSYPSRFFISPSVADLLGRRRAMVVECCGFLIGVAIQLATIRVWQQFATLSPVSIGCLLRIPRMISNLRLTELQACFKHQREPRPDCISRGSTAASVLTPKCAIKVSQL
jgi:hypothetical protein